VKKIFFLPAVLFFVLYSCSNTKKNSSTSKNNSGGDSEQLYQRQWNLLELNGVAVTENVKAYLLFSPGQVNKVSGNTGCNILNGSVELSGESHLKFSPLATTRRACIDNSIADAEKNFLAALTASNAWSIDNDNLILKNGNVITAKFSGAKALTDEEKKLNGSWLLNYISGETAALNTLFPYKKPTLVFNLPGTQAGGNSGCNGFGSTLKLDGRKINFSNIIATMIACQGNGESLFFKQLELVTSYSIDGNTLMLNSNGIKAMTFVRQ
jgi:heat shock protein HslJ